MSLRRWSLQHSRGGSKYGLRHSNAAKPTTEVLYESELIDGEQGQHVQHDVVGFAERAPRPVCLGLGTGPEPDAKSRAPVRRSAAVLRR